ncbi:STAS domain-containing protein [Paracidobacterium acidisoli]|uniref:Anti-sigma factor antagonist n=1 Tax=Paracidobacterium acidisoli TaxID=2303751 RepID=A0A372INK0_9BACT|nr:STAS domain-containing protein [Paracidobacterium acidisoli]MBT9332139.1 STAS domain-containing protein [Paracidobacterium acidisoli]
MSNEPLTIETAEGSTEATRILTLAGPLILSNIFDLQEDLRNHPAPTTIIDLSQVPYMDSAGMGVLINFYVSCQKHGRRLIVVAPNYRVIELFRLTRVDTLITIAASLEEAKAL